MTQSAPRRSRPAKGRFDSLEQEVFLQLWRTYDRLRTLEEELFARFQLSPQQYNAIRLLQGERPGRLPTLTLANRLVSRAPDITRLLDPLEQRGLITRTRPADNRRVVEVAITAAGNRLLAKIAGPLQACHETQLGHLSAKQLRSLRQLLLVARQPHEDETSPWRT